MGADFSRVRLDPLLDYAGVELKQGGVLLDADANELVAIFDRRLRALASDTLGRARVSSTTPDAFKITSGGGTFEISKGRLYVDGLLAENHGAESAVAAKHEFDDLLAESRFADRVDYLKQPYLPVPPALPATGRYVVYLDVWDRNVTHFEQPALVESAVGVETSSRIQTVWQVLVLDKNVGTGTTCESAGELAEWASLVAPSTGRLTTGTFEVEPVHDPCELPPTGGYRGLENQLYRVEIHDAGQPGAGATFKWSRENASVGSRVVSMVSGTELQLQTLGRDDVLRLKTGDWVEIIDDPSEFAKAPGAIRRITVDEATKRIGFAPALPAAMLPSAFPDSTLPKDRNLRVVRWDQKGKVFRTDSSGTAVQVQDLDATGSTGLINVPAPGTTLLLEDGVTVSFDAIGGAGSKGFKAGDYWVFAARTADASVEKLTDAPPRGIHHHFARLAIWDAASGAVTDCRNPWPPAEGACDCSCTQCVTPKSHADGTLTIQDAVNKVADTGGTVCLAAGQYALPNPVQIVGLHSIRITGQGAATMIGASESAFIIQRSAGVTIDDLAIFSLGRRSVISVRTAFGLTLRELVVAVFANREAQGAAIELAGLILGATIRDNLLIAPDGVRGPESKSEEGPRWLLTGAIAIESNIFSCRDSAIKFDGVVGHALETQVLGNQVIGTREIGFSFTGLALPGASLHVRDNNLQLNCPGIRCATDGLWVANNKLHAASDGDRRPFGSGIQLVTGLDRDGSNQAQLLANQIDGFPVAGISIDAPVQDLIVKLNIIESCGNGIVMAGSASAASISIENNHVRDIGLPRAAETGSKTTVGIGLLRTEVGTVAGNTLRRIGVNVEDDQALIAGVSAQSVKRTRIGSNEITEVGPENRRGTTAGIIISAPYERTEVFNNLVERDAAFNAQPSDTEWSALNIVEPILGKNFFWKLANFAVLRLDDARTLVVNGASAWLDVAIAGLDPATGARISPPGASASVLGNMFIARGRAPAVDIAATGDVLFSDNRCESRANQVRPAVQILTLVAIVNANRVRGGEESISIPGHVKVTAIGNITTGQIQAPIPAAMAALNLIG